MVQIGETVRKCIRRLPQALRGVSRTTRDSSGDRWDRDRSAFREPWCATRSGSPLARPYRSNSGLRSVRASRRPGLWPVEQPRSGGRRRAGIDQAEDSGRREKESRYVGGGDRRRGVGECRIGRYDMQRNARRRWRGWWVLRRWCGLDGSGLLLGGPRLPLIDLSLPEGAGAFLAEFPRWAALCRGVVRHHGRESPYGFWRWRRGFCSGVSPAFI